MAKVIPFDTTERAQTRAVDAAAKIAVLKHVLFNSNESLARDIEAQKILSGIGSLLEHLERDVNRLARELDIAR